MFEKFTKGCDLVVLHQTAKNLVNPCSKPQVKVIGHLKIFKGFTYVQTSLTFDGANPKLNFIFKLGFTFLKSTVHK